MTKIGLEIHCQLTKLESKLFCSCKANYREFEPNHNICPVCMGLPGSLPRLNQKAVKSATSIAMALNCQTPEKIAFFRKNYFYPDLPKNFQITQLNVYGDMSVGGEGYVDVEGKKIKIRRIQLEEDPGKGSDDIEYSMWSYLESVIVSAPAAAAAPLRARLVDARRAKDVQEHRQRGRPGHHRDGRQACDWCRIQCPVFDDTQRRTVLFGHQHVTIR